ncbi:hypothetical protein [Dyadobacter sp. NIV53]|uniref:hypothetical protein n=1 Tax=Dyadobacter sp. NIV53 TaxID=2861765 RepID=UPI001C88732A|nr:hypothetical protein [Dyadobacter sp. NIV53]
MKSNHTKKLIFCFLIVLMGACKKDDDKVVPEVDFTSEFIGNYKTQTADAVYSADHLWEVTAVSKNKLGIVYTRNVTATISGIPVKVYQKYALANVTTTAKDSFTINEEVDVEQTGGAALKQKVTGVGTKVTNASGVQQINITLKTTNSSTGVAAEEYLEFKKN